MPPQQSPQFPAPGQPAPASPPQPSGQYDFIMNPGKPARPKMNLGGPGRLLVMIGVIAVVMVILIIGFSALRGNGGNSGPFITLAQEQQEIIRVCGLQYSSLSDQAAKDFVITTQLGMTSDQTKLNQLLSDNGIKVSDKARAQLQDSNTDTELSNALAAHTLDKTMIGVLQNELTQYKDSLAVAYRSSDNQTARQLLVQLSNDADLLLTQSQQSAD